MNICSFLQNIRLSNQDNKKVDENYTQRVEYKEQLIIKNNKDDEMVKNRNIIETQPNPHMNRARSQIDLDSFGDYCCCAVISCYSVCCVFVNCGFGCCCSSKTDDE